MSPLRLIVLAILFYILFRLIFGGKRGAKKTVRQDRRPENLPAHDILVEDPVCHTYVPKKQAVALKHNDVEYHFCSEECRESFLAQEGEKK